MAQITFGEVIDVMYNETGENTYSIRYKQYNTTKTQQNEGSIAVPLNMNYIHIPIKGEIVMIISAPSPYMSMHDKIYKNYYVSLVALQNSLNNNGLPNLTTYTVTTHQDKNNTYSNAQNGIQANSLNDNNVRKIDEDFQENENVRPLQLFIGDTIFQGRYGQSIRFGTEPNDISKYSLTPFYYDVDDKRKPITIIRNSFENEKSSIYNSPIIENLNNDDNCIVLSSGHKLNFTQSCTDTEANESIGNSSWKNEKFGVTPQTLISSGRVILNSMKNEIMLFSKTGIGLCATNSVAIDAGGDIILNAQSNIKIGSTYANEPVVLGNSLQSWIENLIQIIGTITPISPTGPCSPLQSTPQWMTIQQLLNSFSSVLSNTISVD